MGRFHGILCMLTTLLLCQVHCSYLDKSNDTLFNIFSEPAEGEKGVSEFKIQKWLKVFNEELQAAEHQLVRAKFRYYTDMSSSRKRRKLTETTVEMAEWEKEQTKKAKIFLEGKSKEDFKNGTVYRMLKLLTCSSAASDDESVNRIISESINKLEEIYGSILIDGRPLDEVQVLMSSANYDDRLKYWKEWRDAVGPKMRPVFTELIRNLNRAATDNGFTDIGEPWRAGDFGYETENLEEMAVRLFKEIKPLYLQLHAYVRRQLYKKYPDKNIDLEGPIPAHILGNMWAQEWILDDFSPYPDQPPIDITPKLENNYTVDEMFKMAEEFFTSIGLEKMTKKFWKKSQFTRPEGKKVLCQPSAWDMFKPKDYRMIMCTNKNQRDFEVIHHEMGHVEYYMEYSHQPAIFRGGANAAFHEAIGDTIALSVNTVTHFETMGLLDSFQPIDHLDINMLMSKAFQQIAFLPFGYLIDRFRWDVFRGKIDESNYNDKWWELRQDIQGVVSPVERTEEHFDAGAKFHIAANVPYIRYFFATIAQFQFYEAMCKESNHTGPIHRCDFYQSKAAGELLKSMMELGSSKEWPEAMERITGQRKFCAKSILNYFEPLHQWLIQENKKQGEFIGWK